MYQRPLRSDELYHWGLWNPWKKKKHKYIYKVQDGNHVRYFYSQEELDAYRNADKKVNAESKPGPANPLRAVKDFVDYKVTGFGYKRDAKQQNKAIDELSKIQKEHPLKADKDKVATFKEMEAKSKRQDSKLMDPFADTMTKQYAKDREDHIKDVGTRTRRLAQVAEYAKQFNMDEAEKKAMNNSIFGKVSRFFKKRSDNKVVNFMRENPDYAEKWLNNLGITTKDFNPKKAKNADKLKKTLVNRGVMKETDTLNDVLEDRGFVEKERGKMEYYKDSNKKKKKAVKHSDDELQSFLDTNSDGLMHYGRLGMKWYQHIFGPVQSGAKYAQKAGSKIASAKAAHDAKAEAKWEKKKEKVIRSGDPAKVRKYQTRMTDDELRRADNRIAERNKLDKATGHEAKQAQNFVNQNANKTSVDLFKEFGNVANTISNTYTSFDKIMTTLDSAKKYTPEGMAKTALKKEILANRDLDKLIENPSVLNNDETQQLIKSINNDNAIYNYYRDKKIKEYKPVYDKYMGTYGPYKTKEEADMVKEAYMWLSSKERKKIQGDAGGKKNNNK